MEFNDNWGLMQSEKKIPISNFVRTPDELYYCDEPDKWHDLFGHIPPLAIQEYSDMYEYLGKLLVKYKTLNNTYYKQLGTISWYITEVGLIRENGKLKAFGTTLYSSAGELEKAFDPKTILVDATLDSLLEQDGYNRKDLMNKYFVIDSIDQILRDYQVKYLI